MEGWTRPIDNPALCHTFWGSHGCDKHAGHDAYDLVHECSADGEPCSEMIVLGPTSREFTVNAAVRYWSLFPDGHEEWCDWVPSGWFT